MNVFADRLFSLLLGWTGMLFNGLWNLLYNKSSGFTAFLSRFWVPLILLLLVFGTLTDYIIWLIRWRPYFVWRSWLSRRTMHKKLDMTRRYMEELDQAPLDLPEYREDQPPLGQIMGQNEPVHFRFRPFQVTQEEEMAAADAQTGYTQPVAYQESEPSYVPPFPWEQQAGEIPTGIAVQPIIFPYAQTAQVEEPFLPELSGTQWREDSTFFQDSLYLDQAEVEPLPAETSSRRRRANSRKRHSPGLMYIIRDTLMNREDEFAPLDSLPPPVSQADAFHDPYYPQNYSYREPSLPPEARDENPPPQ